MFAAPSFRPAKSALSLMWTVVLALGLLIPVFTAVVSTAPVANAGTGTSPDGRITLTKTASTKALPAGGGEVTYTYTVRNTTSNRMWYLGLTDDTCAPVAATGGMAADFWGNAYLPGAGTATFRCTTNVTSTTTNTATAIFENDFGTQSTVKATETVTVAAGSMACDQLWYGTFQSPQNWLGIFSPASGMNSKVDTTVTYAGQKYDSVAATAINPKANQWVYYVARRGLFGNNAGVWRYDTTTPNVKEQVTLPDNTATITNRLAFDPDGTLWSWATNGRLYSLNSGASRWEDRGDVGRALGGDVKVPNPSGLGSGDMAFDGMGNLWLIGSDNVNNYLYTIGKDDLVGSGTNYANAVGSMGSGALFDGIAFTPNGTLYASATDYSDGGTYGYSQLYTVNMTNGSSTPVGPREQNSVKGMIGDLASCALPKPELQVTKVPDVETTKAGGTITYTVQMKNIGTLAATGVTFTDPVPANTTYVSSTLNGQAVGAPGTNYWSTPKPVRGSKGTIDGVIGAGDTATVTITVRVANPLPAGVTKIVNTGTYDYVGIDPTPTDDPRVPGGGDPTPTPIDNPGLKVEKAASPTSLVESGPVTYTYTVTNTGTEPMKNVSLGDDKCSPVTLDPVATSPDGSQTGDVNGDRLLDTRETWKYSCRQTLTYDPARGGASQTVTNTVTAKGTGTRTNTDATGSAKADVVITPGRPGLALSKSVTDASGNRVAELGEVLTYKFTVRNTGQLPLTNVTVTDAKLGLTGQKCVTALAVGATADCVVTYTVTQADLDAGAVPNTARATATDTRGGPVPSNDSSATLPTPASRTGISIVKAVAPTSVTPVTKAGDTIDYEFTVRNTGTVSLRGVVINDAKCVAPAGLKGGDVNGDALLDPTETWTFGCTHVVTAEEVTAGRVVNSATATGTPPGLPPITSPPSTTTTEVSKPGMTLEKAVKSTVPAVITKAGDVITYSFTVKNTGNVPLTGVRINDLKCTNGPSEPTGDTNGDGALDTTETWVFTCNHTVTKEEVTAGKVDNSATATGTPPGGGVVETPPSTTSTIVQKTGIVIDKTVDSTSPATLHAAGDTVNYSFKVTNAGTTPLTGVKVLDDRCDAAAVYKEGDGNNDHALGILEVWTFTCTHKVTDDEVSAGVVVNSATATGTPPGGLPPVTSEPDTTRTPVVTPAVTVIKNVAVDQQPVHAVGDTIRFYLEATNTGNVGLSNVVMTDQNCDAAPVLQSGDLDRDSVLDPGEKWTYTCSHAVTTGDVTAGKVVNSGRITGDPGGGLPPVDTPSDTITVPVNSPGLAFDKRVAGTSAPQLTAAGQTITFEFDVKNIGNVHLSKPAVNDDRCDESPAYLRGDADGDGKIDPGTTWTYGCTHTVTEAEVAAKQVVNTASATADDPDGKPLRSDPDTTVTPVFPTGLAIDKSVRGTDPQYLTKAGQKVFYVFDVSNTGRVPMKDVVVADGLCDARATLRTGGEGGDTNGDGLLDPTETFHFECEHTLTQGEVDAGEVRNTAHAEGFPAGGTIADRSPDDSTTTQIYHPRISLEKKVTSTEPNPLTAAGQKVNYEFVVHNIGDVGLIRHSLGDDRCDAPPVLVSGDTNGDGRQAPIEEWRYTCAHTVTGEEVTAGLVHNSAVVSAWSPSGKTQVHSDPATTDTPVLREGLTLTKTVRDASGDNRYEAGEQLTYTFTVNNTGQLPLTDVRVVDPRLGVDEICVTGVLAPRTSGTCTVLYTATAEDVSAGSVLNSATARGTTPGGNRVDSPPDEATIGSGSPHLVMAKDVKDASGDGIAQLGERLTYTFTVTNSGELPLYRVTVDDPRLGLVAHPCADTLAPRQSASCSYSYVVTQADLDTGRPLVNVATAAGQTSAGNPVVSPEDAASIPPAGQKSGLLLSKDVVDASGDRTAQVGEVLTYRFTVHNTGDVALTDVRVDDPKVGGAFLCVDRLEPGAQASCERTYTVTRDDVNARQPIVNTATTSGTTPGGALVTSPPDDATIPTAAQHPALEIRKTVADQTGDHLADEREVLHYTFTVTNTGDVDLTGVTITDAKLKLNAVACIDLLPAQSSARCYADYIVTAEDVAAGAVANTATANGRDPNGADVPAQPDEALVPTAKHDPSLALVKKVTDASRDGRASVGEKLSYTFRVTNTGDVRLENVVVNDTKVSPTPIVCATVLEPRASAECTVDYTVTADDVTAGEVVNSATATGVPSTGKPVTTPPSEASLPTGQNSLTVDKSVRDASGDGLAQLGEALTYTFLVRNTGAGELTNIRIVERSFDGAGDRTSLDHPVCATTVLAPGASTTCTATYTVVQADLDRGTPMTNVARAEGTEPGGVTVPSPDDDASVPTAPTRSGLVLDKSVKDADGDARATVGEKLTYTFRVTNSGAVPLTGVVVHDARLSATPIPCADVLAPGATASCVVEYTVTATDVGAGTVVNTAVADGRTPDGTTTPSGPDDAVISTGGSGLDIRKTVADAGGNGIAEVGEVLTYTFTVRNTGATVVTGVRVTEIAFDGSGDRTSLDAPVCASTTLEPGASTTCTARYTVTQTDVDRKALLKNTARAIGTSPDGSPVRSPEDSASIPPKDCGCGTGGSSDGSTGSLLEWIISIISGGSSNGSTDGSVGSSGGSAAGSVGGSSGSTTGSLPVGSLGSTTGSLPIGSIGSLGSSTGSLVVGSLALGSLALGDSVAKGEIPVPGGIPTASLGLPGGGSAGIPPVGGSTPPPPALPSPGQSSEPGTSGPGGQKPAPAPGPDSPNGRGARPGDQSAGAQAQNGTATRGGLARTGVTIGAAIGVAALLLIVGVTLMYTTRASRRED